MESAPWLMVFPGLAIFLTVVIFNLLGGQPAGYPGSQRG